MHPRHWTTIILLPALFTAFTACVENPVAIVEPPSLTVLLEVSPDHIHIWQTEVTFTVSAIDEHGNAVTDFDTIRVERKAHGDETWRAVELEREGDVYVGNYVFASSGDYDLRVAGMRHGDHEMMVLHEMSEHFHVARAHVEAAGYRVEFETFPGHLHEGDEATVRFWMMEAEADEDGERAPITGISAEVHCLESGGVEEHHHAVETEPGLYEADHHVQEAGPMHVGLHFTAQDGTEIEAALEIEIAHGH